MSAAQILGAILVASPFVALFVCAVREFGFLEAVGLFASCGAFVGVIVLGCWLLTGGAA